MKITNKTIQSGIFVIMFFSLLFLTIQTSYIKKEINYSNFVTTLKYYDTLTEKRHETWSLITKTVRDNPKIASEIHDKQNSLSYLLLRSEQSEPLYAIETELLEYEIKSVNLLNELCKNAKKEKKTLLKLTYASDISYYKNKKDDLIKLYEQENVNRKYSKPIFDNLEHFDVGDYFNE